MMAFAAGSALIKTILGILLGIGAYKLLAPRALSTSRWRFARKGLALGVASALVILLPAVGRKSFVNEVAVLVLGLFMLAAFGLVAGWLFGVVRGGKAAPRNAMSDSSIIVAPVKQAHVQTDDHLYDRIGRELESGKRDLGTWTRAVADADGNPEVARARYIKYRVQSLKSAAPSQTILGHVPSATVESFPTATARPLPAGNWTPPQRDMGYELLRDHPNITDEKLADLMRRM
jgi:hypothetical protein